MKRAFFLLSCLFAPVFVWAQVHTPEQQKQIYDSAMVCFEAVKAGDLEKLPQLGEFLKDPRLSAAARTTLENLPNQAGLPVLRGALASADAQTPDGQRCLAGTIASLGAMRDTDSVSAILPFAKVGQPEIVRTAALKALGNLAVPEAVSALKETLKDESLTIRRAAADGLFTAARNIQTAEPAKAAEWFRSVREAAVDGPTFGIAVQNEILLTNDAALLESLLKSAEDADFRSARIILSRTSNLTLLEKAVQLVPSFEVRKQEQLFVVLGISGVRDLTPSLLALWTNPAVVRPALLSALGSLKDIRALETCVSCLGEEDEVLRAAAVSALCQFPKKELYAPIQALLKENSPADSPIKVRRCLAGIEIAGTLKMSVLLPMLKLCMMDDPNPETSAAAMLVYSRILIPTPGDVAEFATVFARQEKFSPETIDAAMENLCRRISAKEETLDFLMKTYENEPVQLVRYAGMVGGKAAAEFLGKLAQEYAKDVSLPQNILAVDEATKFLGKWASADAAPVLARLAVTLPIEKFRIRSLRGYFRILRQMGMTPLEKRQMLNTAFALTEDKQSERERFAQIADHFNRQFPETRIFNGKDFTGWEMIADVFKIEDGAIVGGNFETGVDRNQFLTTKETYGDFYLRMECKIIDGPTNNAKDGNAGVQIRSVRLPNNHEMVGYQADMTSNGGYWGHLYDESRRRRMLQTPDPELIKAIWKPNDWNRYEILCQGKNIRIFLNGVETVNYTETDDSIPQTGLIGLQIHSGGPARSYYRNIFISTAATSDSRW